MILINITEKRKVFREFNTLVLRYATLSASLLSFSFQSRLDLPPSLPSTGPRRGHWAEITGSRWKVPDPARKGRRRERDGSISLFFGARSIRTFLK